MSSLSEIASKKIISMSTRHELPNGSNDLLEFSEKLPKEVLVKLVKNMNKELVETKKELVNLKELYLQDDQEKLKMVEDAHKYGFCREKFEGKCHLCEDDQCILCCEDEFGPLPLPCVDCYIQRCRSQILRFKKQLETREDEHNDNLFCDCKKCIILTISFLEQSISDHAKGECNCNFINLHA